MANLKMHTGWAITELRREEFVLILKALGGRLATEAEQREARELGDKLSAQRATMTRQVLQENEKLFESLREAGVVE